MFSLKKSIFGNFWSRETIDFSLVKKGADTIIFSVTNLLLFWKKIAKFEKVHFWPSKK